MINKFLEFIKKHKWIFTISSFIIALSTFLIKEETRNFVWNQGWLFPLLVSFLFNISLIIYLVYKSKIISESDKEIYNASMSLLVYDNVDYYLYECDMGGPLNWTEITRFYHFKNYCFSSKFQIKDKKLKKLMIVFRDSLRDFLNKLALYTFPSLVDVDIVSMPKEYEIEEKGLWEKQRKELNHLATIAHQNFTELIKYAKEKEIDKTK